MISSESNIGSISESFSTIKSDAFRENSQFNLVYNKDYKSGILVLKGNQN